jgi:hypothetical protein
MRNDVEFLILRLAAERAAHARCLGLVAGNREANPIAMSRWLPGVPDGLECAPVERNDFQRATTKEEVIATLQRIGRALQAGGYP